VWKRYGWTPGATVWRLEFQFRRETLRGLGIGSFAELEASLGCLWAYATQSWLRLADPASIIIKNERFDSISHLVGAVLALAGAVVLVVVASRVGNTRRIFSFSIYGATLFLLYLISMLYHGLPTGRAKHVFRVLDYQAIDLLIAGNYTPFTLVTLDGIAGWWLIGTIW